MPPGDEGMTARVLVVDDNEANRALAKSALEDEGYEVDLASGGAEGLAAFQSRPPDCVLLDVRMPDLDGFQVCERIRVLPHGPETPVLFLTALRDVDTFDRALRAGGDDFLTKPIRPTELVVRVQTALRLRRMTAEIREQYEVLKRQRDDLLRVQLQRERLMSFVVHDLKNPVHTMDLNAQLLLHDDALPAELRENAEHIRAAANQLSRMILNLLDVAKGDEGKLAPRRTDVDLATLVEDVLAEMSVLAAAYTVGLGRTIKVDRVHSDEDLLRRTLANLVENAIRYAPPQTTVSVSAARVDAGVEIRVADQGAGIPPELRERVFDPFVQGDPAEHPSSRTSRGLGLTFCKLAVEAHGGTIRVEDGAPGAVFCLTLLHGR